MSVEVKVQYTYVVRITSPPDGYRFPVGSAVALAWTYDAPQRFRVDLQRPDGTWKSVSSWITARSFTIPGSELTTVGTYRVRVLPEIGSSDTINITAYTVTVNTFLTISVSPTPPIDPRATLTFTGKLSRTDTGAGVPSQKVDAEQPPGTRVGSGVTDSAGNYRITITAPATEATYKYRTKFTGTSGYGTAVSKTLGIGVGIATRWAAIKAWWNRLNRWQKAAILTTSLGSVIIGGAALKKT